MGYLCSQLSDRKTILKIWKYVTWDKCTRGMLSRILSLKKLLELAWIIGYLFLSAKLCKSQMKSNIETVNSLAREIQAKGYWGCLDFKHFRSNVVHVCADGSGKKQLPIERWFGTKWYTDKSAIEWRWNTIPIWTSVTRELTTKREKLTSLGAVKLNHSCLQISLRCGGWKLPCTQNQTTTTKYFLKLLGTKAEVATY